MQKNELIYLINRDNIDIKTYLRKELCLSARAVTKLKTSGIFLNDEHANVTKIMQKGDVLKLIPTENIEVNYEAENIPLNIVYEDENFLVINKPPFMTVYPAGEHMTGSLLNAVAFYDKNMVFRPIYRLDRNTSGLVCIAKNRIASNATITKEYMAVCEGICESHGIIDSKICLAEGSRIKRTTGDGQTAKTEYFMMKNNNSHSLMKVVIYTGRTHQIRVHMSSIGHPLAGDDLYGGKTNLINRQALHCKKIKIFHSALNTNIEIDSELPEDMNIIF